ncbi:MAG TPA: sensor histidine kinase [Fibrobacteraceae bacterium]|nr:sensor histidine kinase [Fibrobacteraceae bacterium]
MAYLNEAFLDTLDQLDLGVALVTGDDELQSLNRTMRQLLLRIKGDDLVLSGSDLFVAFGIPPLAPEENQDSRKCEPSGQVLRVNRKRMQVDGRNWLLVQAQDLTGEQQQAKSMNRQISDLLFKVRSRITPVQNAVTLFLKYPDAIAQREAKDLFGISYLELWQLERWLDNLRDFSLLNSGDIGKYIQPNDHDLKELVDAATNSLLQAIQTHDRPVQIRNNIPPDLHAFVDRERLLRVLEGLLLNSVEYCKEEPLIVFSAQERGDRILLSITDNGIGINAEEQGLVFEYGFRAKHPLVHNVSGSGTDLWYSRQILTRMDARIEFTSSPQGSLFTLDVPASHV